jgi:antirestriction protein ArdC
MLWASTMKQGFAAPIWMTYRQAQELGGQVRKGVVDTIAKALELGRETGLYDHDVEPAELVAFEIVNQ